MSRQPTTNGGGKPPTIRDVARRAGVSVATVSAVVNKSKRVSDALTKRVEEAIAELGYRQNLLARALYTKRTRSLAFLVPSIANPFFSAVLKVVEDTAHQSGYSVFVGSTNGDLAKVEFYKERLLAMGIDGVLVALSWDIVSSGIVGEFLAQQVPVVGVAGSRVLPGIDCFVSDDRAGGEQAARYLAGLGHRQIAFVGALESHTTVLRYEGICGALAALAIRPDPRLLVQVEGYEEGHAYQAVSELITRNVSFTALVAFNDIMAIGALRALEDQGFSVPSRVSLVGFDDTVAAYSRPKLTTIACPKQELGEMGVQRLLARLEGENPEPVVCRLPTRLVTRESTRVVTD